MPRGFVKLGRAGGAAHTYTVAVDQIARYGAQQSGCYVVLKTVDGGENETLNVLEAPAEIDALIEDAQSEVTV